MKTFEDGFLDKETTWDAAGNGDWKRFDEGENIIEEGSWTV